MNSPFLSPNTIKIRPVQFRDLEAIASLLEQTNLEERNSAKESLYQKVKKLQSCYGLLQLFQLFKFFPHYFDNDFSLYIAEKQANLQGLIQISPYNKARSTWRIEQLLTNPQIPNQELLIGNKGIGSQLVRHCLANIWEARTWVSEININEKQNLGFYRENGFQPMAQNTYWSCSSEILTKLSQNEPNLPNLLPVSNADALLLYQLDCVSMPPLLRQVFDLHIEDFKTDLFTYTIQKIKQIFEKVEVVSGYVFEPQRKAAIGYFKLELCQNGAFPHQAELTVHPAYTWLYPKLLSQMALVIQRVPPQCLHLASSDYQPEREEYLEKLKAERIQHTVLMSRSVWHKLKEAKHLESLNFQEVLQGFKPAHNPIPTPWLKSMLKQSQHLSSSQDQPKNDHLKNNNNSQKNQEES